MCSFRVFEQTRNVSQEPRGGKEKKRNEKSWKWENGKPEKADEETKTSLDEKEDKFTAKENEISVSLSTAQQLLEEGNEKLKEAIKKGNLQHAATAHLMIETGTTKTKECTKALEKFKREAKKVGWQEAQAARSEF